MIIGVVIGMNVVFFNIVMEWFLDIKMGYCIMVFYLNESFCCWGEEDGKFFLLGDDRDRD